MAKRPPKSIRKNIIKKLDEVFSQYIRLRDSDSRGIVTCPLCGTKIEWKKAQNMHFVSRGVLKYRYNEKNCHAGCMRCNVILNGNYIVYTRRMQRKYGIPYVDSIINDKQVFSITTPQLEKVLEYYIEKRDKLLNKF